MATAAPPTRPNLSGGQIALIVLGALIVLLALLWFFVLRGEPAVETTAPPIPAPVASPTPEPEETARARNRPVETFEVFAPKDPFRPALAAATAGTTGTTGTTGANGTGNGGVTGGTTNGDGISGGTNGGGNGGGQTVGGRRVRLVDVFTEGERQRARVQVDGTVYTVSEGDRFADNFELLGIEGQCASLLHGDDQFTLCEGEEILK